MTTFLTDSWLVHDKWIVPLAAIITALGTTTAIIIAGYIGHRAGEIARAQRNITGLSEINKLREKLDTPRWRNIQRNVAIDYLCGRVDRLYAAEILDFIEDLAMYVDRDLISVEIIESLMVFDVICWWYAVRPAVELERAHYGDRTIGKVERGLLIPCTNRALHKASLSGHRLRHRNG